MKTKILYVLVSSEKDIYLEQAYISMYSAKYYMPDAHITLLTDKATNETFHGIRAKEIEYVDETVVVDLDITKFNAQQRSRQLKTNARNYVDGDYLYIDVDTIIVKPLYEIDEVEYSMAACWDTHSDFESNPYRWLALEHGKLLVLAY